MTKTPMLCSYMCATEFYEAQGLPLGPWVDTESEAFLDAQADETIEICEWCSPS